MKIKKKWITWEELMDILGGGYAPGTEIYFGNVGGLTTGSIPFADAAGYLAEDNDKLFWDAVNFRLGLGTLGPATALHIITTDTTIMTLDSTSASYITNAFQRNATMKAAFGLWNTTGGAGEDGVTTFLADDLYFAAHDGTIWRDVLAISPGAGGAAKAFAWFSPNVNVGFGTSSFGAAMVGGLAMKNAITPPAAGVLDCFQMYSADQVGGNACPHFMTENGTVIGLNQSLFTTDSPVFVGLELTGAALLGLNLSSITSQIYFSGGAGEKGIAYKDTGGAARYAMMFPLGSDVVHLLNRAANGTVEIHANQAAPGLGGDVKVAEFQDDIINLSVNLAIRNQEELRFYEGVNYVGFEAPDLGDDQIWVLPNADSPDASKALGSDAADALGWYGHDDLFGYVANEHIDWTNTAENFLTTGTLGAGQTALTSATLADDARGLSSIFTLSADPAKSDGIALYTEGHIGAITTNGPTYGAGIWLNIDAGAILGADVRVLDIGIYERNADCTIGNAYGLAIHLDFDLADPPAAIYPFRLNCEVTGATPDALIFAANKSALAVTEGDFPYNNYLKIVIQDGTIYKIPLITEGAVEFIALHSNGELRFYDNGNYVGFEAPALDADQIWVLPTEDGDANDFLQTDGLGNLTWAAGGAGAATFLALTDTPAGYAGEAGKFLKVNAVPDALEFVSHDKALHDALTLDHGTLSGLADVGDHNWASTKTTAAWSKTIGATGDYPTWAAMIADMPNLISHAVTITIEYGTTLTAYCRIQNKHGLASAAEIKIQAERYYPTAAVIPTADSATATTLRDAVLAAEAYGDDYFNGCWILVVHGTGTDNGYVPITDYVDATGDVVVGGGWPGTRPDATSRYIILGAMIDGGSVRSYGMEFTHCTVPIELYGIGIKDTTDTAINARYLTYLYVYYIGLYETVGEGFNLRNVGYARLRRSGFVKCGTQGIDITACANVELTENGISDNVAYGVTVRHGGFCTLTNNFGDLNGTYGTYCYRSGQAIFVGTECSGTSGNHQYADGNFQDMTVYGIEMKPGQPSFFVFLSAIQSDVTGDNTAYVVPFDTEVFDQGGDYANPTFTAPVDGRYLLTASIRIKDIVGTYVKAQFLTSNNLIEADMKGTANPGSGGDFSVQISVITDMDASDTAVARIINAGGAKTADCYGSASIRTYFSGALIC